MRSFRRSALEPVTFAFIGPCAIVRPVGAGSVVWGGGRFWQIYFPISTKVGRIIPTTLLLAPPYFHTYLLPCYKLASSRIARHSMLLAYFPHGEPRNYTLGSCVLYFTKNMSSGSKMAWGNCIYYYSTGISSGFEKSFWFWNLNRPANTYLLR